MTAEAPDARATSVVIVNYRTKELTQRAATSVLGEPEVGQLLIVDNGSEDGSAECLRRALSGTCAEVLQSPSNVGFGAAVNLAAARATLPLLFLLNSDATVEPGCLRALADRLLERPSNAVAAPVVYETAPGKEPLPRPQRGAFGSFPAVWDPPWRQRRMAGTMAEEDGELSPDWVSAVAMLVRRRDFLSIGGFDTDFHMYLEDVDLCRRFRERGMDVVREPASVVVHLGGRSWRSGVDQRERFQTSKIKYFTKAGASPAQLAYLNALGAARVLAARCWLPVRRVWP